MMTSAERSSYGDFTANPSKPEGLHAGLAGAFGVATKGTNMLVEAPLAIAPLAPADVFCCFCDRLLRCLIPRHWCCMRRKRTHIGGTVGRASDGQTPSQMLCFGDWPILVKPADCWMRCEGGDDSSLNIESFVPTGRDVVGLRIRRLAAIKLRVVGRVERLRFAKRYGTKREIAKRFAIVTN